MMRRPLSNTPPVQWSPVQLSTSVRGHRTPSQSMDICRVL